MDTANEFIDMANGLLRTKARQSAWPQCAAFSEWILSGSQLHRGMPNWETAESFLGSILFLELVERARPQSLEVFPTELLAMAAAFCHPIVRVGYTIGLYSRHRDEGMHWDDADMWEPEERTYEEMFVHRVRAAKRALDGLFGCPAAPSVNHPLLRSILSAPVRATVARVASSGSAKEADEDTLIRAFVPLCDRIWQHGEDRQTTLAPALSGRCADRSVSQLLKDTASVGLNEVTAQEGYRRDLVRLVSTLRHIRAGDLSLVGAVMESTHLFKGQSRTKWFASTAFTAAGDARALRIFAKGLARTEYRGIGKPQGENSLTQDERHRLNDWYYAQGKPMAAAATRFRRWLKSVGGDAGALPPTPAGLPRDSGLAECQLHLQRLWRRQDWLCANGDDLAPYELVIATWLADVAGRLEPQVCDDLFAVRCRARQAWREIQPDRIELVRRGKKPLSAVCSRLLRDSTQTV